MNYVEIAKQLALANGCPEKAWPLFWNHAKAESCIRVDNHVYRQDETSEAPAMRD